MSRDTDVLQAVVSRDTVILDVDVSRDTGTLQAGVSRDTVILDTDVSRDTGTLQAGMLRDTRVKTAASGMLTYSEPYNCSTTEGETVSSRTFVSWGSGNRSGGSDRSDTLALVRGR